MCIYPNLYRTEELINTLVVVVTTVYLKYRLSNILTGRNQVQMTFPAQILSHGVRRTTSDS